MKRGMLIEFESFFDGKVRCAWRGIYHGGNTLHRIGERGTGEFRFSGLRPEDRLTPIKHGIRIFRDLDAVNVLPEASRAEVKRIEYAPKNLSEAVALDPETGAALRAGGRSARWKIIWRLFRNMARWVGFRNSFRLTRALLKNNTPENNK